MLTILYQFLAFIAGELPENFWFLRINLSTLIFNSEFCEFSVLCVIFLWFECFSIIAV